jgi:sec-independent protein translocase protein TatB
LPEDGRRDLIVFDLAWSEMAIILVVALVVVGPKDLPRLARTLGQWVAKGRAMAREFQRHVDDMAREADLQDLKDSVGKISPAGIREQITKSVDPDGTLGKALDTRDINRAMDVKAPASPPATAAKTESPAPGALLGPAASTSAGGDAGTAPAAPAKPAEPAPAAATGSVRPAPAVPAPAASAPAEPASAGSAPAEKA